MVLCSEEALTEEGTHGRLLQQVTGSGQRGAVAATSGRGFAAVRTRPMPCHHTLPDALQLLTTFPASSVP